MKRVLFLASTLVLTACTGAVLTIQDEPHSEMGAVIVSGQFSSMGEPTSNGKTAIGLETREGLSYRLPVKAGQTLLYQVRPGTYHLAPVRSFFGTSQRFLSANINGRAYRMPFPQELANAEEIEIKPSQIYVLGALDVEVLPPLPGREPLLKVDLKNFAADRRILVQNLIQRMMDQSVSSEQRQNAQSWLNSLQKTLISLEAQPQTPLDQAP